MIIFSKYKILFNLSNNLLFDLKAIGLSIVIAGFCFIFFKKYISKKFFNKKILIAAILFFILINSILVYLKIINLHFFSESANRSQAYYNTFRYGFMKSSLSYFSSQRYNMNNDSIIKGHSYIFSIFLAIIYKILGSNIFYIFFLKILSIAVTSYFLYKITYYYSKDEEISVLTGLNYLICFASFYTALFEIRPVTFALAFISIGYYLFLKQKIKYGLLFFLLALFCKESVIYFMIYVSLLFYRDNRKKESVLVMCISVLYTLFVSLVYWPIIMKTSYLFAKQLPIVGSFVYTKDYNILAFLIMILFFLVLNIFWVFDLFVCNSIIILILFYFCVGRLTVAYTIYGVYFLNILFLVFLGSIINFKKINFLKVKKYFKYLLLLNIILLYFLGPLPFTYSNYHKKSRYNLSQYLLSKHHSVLKSTLKFIKQNDSVEAPQKLLLPLHKRKNLASIYREPWNKNFISNKYEYPTKIIIVDLLEKNFEYKTKTERKKYYDLIRYRILKQNYQPIFYKDYILVLKKKDLNSSVNIKNINKIIDDIFKDLDKIETKDKDFFNKVNLYIERFLLSGKEAINIIEKEYDK